MSIFDKIRVRKPKYSTFDLSHEKKLSMKMGTLVPTLLQEVVPGDRIKCQSEIMMRLAPMIAPVMHRVNVYTHYFFVPNRIIWDEWESFITGGVDGTETPSVPKVSVLEENYFAFGKGSLADYLGIPDPTPWAGNIQAESFSALPFRAYQQIYNDYYRDQTLTPEVNLSNTAQVVAIRKRSWEKDYFTSALPWAQRGEEVNLPINWTPEYKTAELINSATGDPVPGVDVTTNSAGEIAENNLQTGREIHNLADEQTNAGLTVNELRRANRLQQWLERNARGGSRYIEQIYAHFGVKSSDARLQRAEYLGGGRQPVTLSEVLNTTGLVDTRDPSELDGGNVQGAMAGHGISVGSTNYFNRRFEEHGYVLGITSVLPRTAYQQGTPKTFRRYDKFDYYFPEFANLGEQEIQQRELYQDYGDSSTGNDATFGYTPRYAEYKYQQSTVHGDFKDNLDFWHMGRKFENVPQLNEEFVEADPTDRIFAVQDGTDTLWTQIYHNIKAVRPMPYYGTPML